MAAAEEHQAQRPVAHEPRRLPTYAVEIELIEKAETHTRLLQPND